MNKTSSIKNKKRNFYLVFIAYFIPLYLMSVICFWAFNNVQYYKYIQSSTKSFIENDRDAIYNTVLTTAFEEGKSCLLLTDETSKKLCYQNTTRIIADALHEEELLAYSEDLMFVKSENGKLYSLGWSGEVKEIVQSKNFIQRNLHVPQVLTLLMRQCYYFNLYDGSRWGCEVYVPLNDSTGTLGYVVRLATLTEEDWLVFVFLSPLFLLLLLPNLNALIAPMYIGLLLMVLIPGLIATYLARRNRQR